ncbi:thyroxine-binding globulin isoform X1 [Ornithorhynchus anatinus]|uniref:Thyroxine-binding globulin n=1 Tax=Ornithorhynchus anatinus TaxID=9258 RepID=F7DEE8_ORNAN|nr:thyroxine-binding globulin isoform X1 [Ornithorhynchus anatinus]XP_028935405.1 thyroxine-binding globulin isoform X1 [Ornithorhynchus anatinus]XP_028935457.1 thyroxine-binding globulin isoform X1 [Ornithorhynchus anatinus]
MMPPSFFLLFMLAAVRTAVKCYPKPSGPEEGTAASSVKRNETFYEMATTNANFAFSLYRRLVAETPDRNILFSPVSISTSLAALSLGAQSASPTRVLEGLHFNLSRISEWEIREGFQRIVHILHLPTEHLELRMGNALFVDERLRPLVKSVDGAREAFAPETFPTDFTNASKAVRQIDSLVGKQTEGKIVDLVRDLAADTSAVLVSYLVFKARWKEPFDLIETRPGDFLLGEKKTVAVPMMSREAVYHRLIDEELACTALQLDYSQRALALLVLPEEGQMKRVEEALSPRTLRRWNRLLRKGMVRVFVPRFSISATYELEDFLRKMGFGDAFGTKADFPEISEQSDIKLSKALHGAVLGFTEKGTEAGATTGPSSGLRSDPIGDVPCMRFNRPFLFMVLEKDTRSILFLGKITNPSETTAHLSLPHLK